MRFPPCSFWQHSLAPLGKSKEKSSRKIKALQVHNISLVPSICHAPMTHQEISPPPWEPLPFCCWLRLVSSHYCAPLWVICSIWTSFGSSFTNHPCSFNWRVRKGERWRRILLCFCHLFHAPLGAFCINGDLRNPQTLFSSACGGFSC